MRDKNQNSFVHINVRVTNSEKVEIVNIAGRLGLTVSDFVRRAIYESLSQTKISPTPLATLAICNIRARPNLEFREDWEVVHDKAAARRQAASKAEDALMMRWHELDDTDRAEMRRHHAEWEEAHEVCKRCLDLYQHRTFEDALAWLNRCFCADDPVVINDFTKFENLPEMTQAAYKIYMQARAAKQE